MKHNLLYIFILILGVFSSESVAQQWETMGDAFIGITESRLGNQTDLNADGTILVMGAYTDNTNGTDVGKVTVHQWDGNQWNPMGAPLFGHEIEGSLGLRVAINAVGDRIAVSEHEHNGSGTLRGRVYVYDWDGSNWQEATFFEAPVDFARYGGSEVYLNAEGNTLAIGSGNANSNTGLVEVYYEENGVWSQKGQTLHGQNPDDAFCKVAISGDGNTMVIGALNFTLDAANMMLGAFYIYEFEGTGWILTKTVYGDQPDRRLGFSVSIDDAGEMVAVSALGNTAQNVQGQAFIYEKEANDWEQQGSPIQTPAGDSFGFDIILSGDGSTFAVSATEIAITGGTGVVYSYRDNGSGFEPLYDPIIGQPDYYVGYGLSLDYTGSTMAFGAPSADVNSIKDGWVQVYRDPQVLGDLQEQAGANLSIFPNPSSGDFSIRHSEGIINPEIRILDVIGREIPFQRDEVDNTIKLEVNAEAGVYLLKINKDRSQWIKRLVVE